MGEKAEYKNARRSRKMILEAYVELMQEKEFDKITVTDIVKHADLNRGTFYAHYQNPLAVLAQIENDIISKMMEFLQEFHYKNFFQDPLPLLLKVESYIEENLEFFRKLIGSNGSDQFIMKLQGIFVEYMENNVEIPESIKSTRDFLIRAHFFAGGIANTYQAWFHGALDKSLHEISLVIGDIITSTFATLFDEDK
jgi:AcrR family transcriptional regulator